MHVRESRQCSPLIRTLRNRPVRVDALSEKSRLDANTRVNVNWFLSAVFDGGVSGVHLRRPSSVILHSRRRPGTGHGGARRRLAVSIFPASATFGKSRLDPYPP